MVIDLLT